MSSYWLGVPKPVQLSCDNVGYRQDKNRTETDSVRLLYLFIYLFIMHTASAGRLELSRDIHKIGEHFQ